MRISNLPRTMLFSRPMLFFRPMPRAGIFLVVLTMVSFATVAAAEDRDPEARAVQGAQEALRRGDLTAAESLLAPWVAQGSAAALEAHGIVAARSGRMAEAEQAFRRAVEGLPSAPGPRLNLARLYLRAGRTDEAASTLRGAAELGPLDRDLAAFLADAEEKAGNSARAEAVWHDLAQRYDTVHALRRLATLKLRRGELDGALEDLRRALDRAPSSEQLLSLFARAALSAKQPALALRPLEALVRMVPDDEDYPYLLGVTEMQLGMLPEAEQILFSYVEQHPDHLLSHIALGLSLNRGKKFSQAEGVLERALQLEPSSAEAAAAMAEALVGLDRFEDAEGAAARALASRPDHPMAKLALGMVRMRQQRFAEARDLLQESVQTDPSSAKAHYQLSLALARTGDRDGSRKHQDLYRSALKEAENRLLALRGVRPAVRADSTFDSGDP